MMDEEARKRLLKKMGKTIRLQRKAMGLSQKQLADKFGRDNSSITRIEKGERDPAFTFMIELLDATGHSFIVSRNTPKQDKKGEEDQNGH